MDKFYIWACTKNKSHFVTTSDDNTSKIPNNACPQCGGSLTPFKQILDDDDGTNRVAFDMESAKANIEKKGYYAHSVTTRVTYKYD